MLSSGAMLAASREDGNALRARSDGKADAKEAANSPKEAGVGVFVDDAQGGGQGFGCRVRRIAVPLAIGPLPEEMPDILAADILHLGDGPFGMLAGTIESRAHDEKLDGLVGEALALADLVAQMQGRT